METIDARKAVTSAIDYLNQMKDLMSENFSNPKLEELELSDDRQFWLVTLGYDVPYKLSNIEKLINPPPNLLGNTAYRRAYKILHVDRNTGQVQSMKIRSI